MLGAEQRRKFHFHSNTSREKRDWKWPKYPYSQIFPEFVHIPGFSVGVIIFNKEMQTENSCRLNIGKLEHFQGVFSQRIPLQFLLDLCCIGEHFPGKCHFAEIFISDFSHYYSVSEVRMFFFSRRLLLKNFFVCLASSEVKG